MNEVLMIEIIKEATNIHDIDNTLTEMNKCIRLIQGKKENAKKVVAFLGINESYFNVGYVEEEQKVLFRWSTYHTLEGQGLDVLQHLYSVARKSSIEEIKLLLSASKKININSEEDKIFEEYSNVSDDEFIISRGLFDIFLKEIKQNKS